MNQYESKIIHVMTHPPAYEEYADKPRPANSWNTLNGSWVGIWGYDWADLLSIEVRKICKEFTHEIWQPDLRADQIYGKEIYPGVSHILFPADEFSKWIGLRKTKELYSPEMITKARSYSNIKVFHIGQSVTSSINKKFLEIFQNVPFVFSFHGQITLPVVSLFKFNRNFPSKIYYLKEHFYSKKLFKRIHFLTFQSNKNLSYLSSYYKGNSLKITMGIDFEKYQGYEKEKCRSELKLPVNRKILLTVCRLYSLKQVDKIIEVLSTIKKDFLFIVVGHGTRSYEEYLRVKAETLIKNRKIIFTGYKTGLELVKYYHSADLFIHVSKAEAGPVTIMEAMACGVPVFCTDTGNTSEILKANNSGVVVGVKNYRIWRKKLIDYIEGEKINALEISIAKQHYDWSNVAREFVHIYNNTNCDLKKVH
jgi:glycosyltransferase involved in cell wall biosynthesis